MSVPACACGRPRAKDRNGNGGAFLRSTCNLCRSKRRRAAHQAEPSAVVEVEIDLDDGPELPEPGPLRTIAILCDVHVPEHDRRAWACALSVLREARPTEVILAGDFLELASVSQHGGADLVALDSDLAAGRRALAELRDAVGPDATLTYLEGNHETRLARFLATRAPSVAGSLSLPEGLQLAELGVRWVAESAQPIERGALRVYHGHQDFPGRAIPQHHAARVAQLRGRRGTTLAYGHTHLPQTASGRGEDAGVAVGLGCLRTLSPSWLHGYAAGWRHGFGLAYLRPSGAVDLYPVAIQHGAAAYAGKLYVGAGGG